MFSLDKLTSNLYSVVVLFNFDIFLFKVTLQSDNEDNRATLESLIQDIATLSVSDVKISTEKPKGSVPTPVTADTVAWMKLQVGFFFVA